MGLDQFLDALGPEQRSVPRQHQDGVSGDVAHRLEGRHHRVTGPQLLGLECGGDAVGKDRGDVLGAMSDHHGDLIDTGRICGGDHPGDEWTPGDLEENLGQIGVHPLAFACGQDDRANAHGDHTSGFRWGDRTRTRTARTKTWCAASYTTPHRVDAESVGRQARERSGRRPRLALLVCRSRASRPRWGCNRAPPSHPSSPRRHRRLPTGSRRCRRSRVRSRT